VRNWSPTAEDFDGPVTDEVLESIRDLSVQLRPGERVERVAVATKPRVVLLVMTDSYLNLAYEVAGIFYSEGTGRSNLRGRMHGDRLIVSEPPHDPGTAYGGIVPLGSAERIAAELHKPFRPDQDGDASANLRS
jgi:hypothetical protein